MVRKTLAIFPAIISAANAFAPVPLNRFSTYLDAEIQFVRGLEEKDVPDIKLTRARDGSSGTATFRFANPNVFDASTASSGDVTGMFLIDEEGELRTADVNAKFMNGKPQSIESVLVMNSPEEWDRFMRFMERYAEANGLGFTKAGGN
jgi:photosystem II protein